MDPSFLPLGTRIGYFEHRDPFGIRQEDRRSHMWVIGGSSTGKTRFIQQQIQADIQAGRGVGLIDPHGDLSLDILSAVPPERVQDVVLIDMTDTEWPVALNVLHGAPTPDAVASTLVGAFKDYFEDSWGPRLEWCLYNSLGLLSSVRDTSLLGVRRLLVDETYRAKLLRHVHDPSILAYWRDEFPKTERDQREWTPSIQNKIGQFFASSLIRNCLGQPSGRITLRDVMDRRGILIARIPKGVLGPAATSLFGSLLVSLFQAAALQREDTPEEERIDFHLYVEEFQNFMSMSFAHALSEVRKYRLNLILVNQYSKVLKPVILDSILTNCGTIISFRVGSHDAELLSQEFAGHFPSPQFVNLARRHILVRLLEHSVQCVPFEGETTDCIKADFGTADLVRQHTRDLYARPRAEVERKIARFLMAE